MQNKKSISLKYKAILIALVLVAALFASCENLFSKEPDEMAGGGGKKICAF